MPVTVLVLDSLEQVMLGVKSSLNRTQMRPCELAGRVAQTSTDGRAEDARLHQASAFGILAPAPPKLFTMAGDPGSERLPQRQESRTALDQLPWARRKENMSFSQAFVLCAELALLPAVFGTSSRCVTS